MSNIGAPVRSRGPVVALRTLKERARPGRRAWTLPELDVPSSDISEQHRRATPPDLPQVSEVDVVRHFTRLAMRALADGRWAMAGTWLTELDRLNEREAMRARSAATAAERCPDGIEEIGHGKAA